MLPLCIPVAILQCFDDPNILGHLRTIAPLSNETTLTLSFLSLLRADNATTAALPNCVLLSVTGLAPLHRLRCFCSMLGALDGTWLPNARLPLLRRAGLRAR